jgi:hypothetical protein
MTSIPNWGGALPKDYKTDSHGDIKELDIKKLFRMIILGPSFSGKNNLVFHMIKSSPNVYSHLHIIARNPNQELYNYMKDKLQGFCTIHDPANPPSVDQIKPDPNGGLQLVVIDDYSNDAILQKRLFSHYFTRGRHFKLSTIFLSHSYFATDKMIRNNTEYVAILKANSKRDLKMIVKDFNINGIDDEKLFHAYNIATESKGQMLFCDSVKSEIRYNFNKVIDPATL